MVQIRIHGRGGQGAVTAAEIIAIAAFNDGKESQAFPSFGVERTGAPVESYARIDNNPIRTREQIYSPDVLLVLDASLINSVNITNGSHKNTVLIINTGKSKEELKIKLPAKNIHTVDATKIAIETIGKNIVNTVILGSFAKITGLVSLEALEKSIKEKFSGKNELIEKNIEAIKRAYSAE